jgi:N-acetyl-gamma-glutamyl-phosphate reductase
MHEMATVSIVGAAGYTGQETLDRVLGHPNLELHALGSNSLAGKDASSLDPRLRRSNGRALPQFIRNEAALVAEADITFLCLSHEEAAEVEPSGRGIVIDLSGAHRLRDPDLYRRWYAFEHPRPEQLGGWSYGLPELTPPTGSLIANPGCYATATLLALGPIKDAVDPGSVVVDAKSGMTGAGRSLKASSHAGSVLENFLPYKVGVHQHVPEIAQLIGFPLSFTPHLLPLRRGLLATCYVRSTGPDLRSLLEQHYAQSELVSVLPEGVSPEIARVHATDRAEIGVFADGFTDRTIVVCAIDNLGKGAAGQAVQNANRLFGWPETTGLRVGGVLV